MNPSKIPRLYQVFKQYLQGCEFFWGGAVFSIELKSLSSPSLSPFLPSPLFLSFLRQGIAIYPRLSLKSRSSCYSFPRARIMSLYYQTQQSFQLSAKSSGFKLLKTKHVLKTRTVQRQGNGDDILPAPERSK